MPFNSYHTHSDSKLKKKSGAREIQNQQKTPAPRGKKIERRKAHFYLCMLHRPLQNILEHLCIYHGNNPQLSIKPS